MTACCALVYSPWNLSFSYRGTEFAAQVYNRYDQLLSLSVFLIVIALLLRTLLLIKRLRNQVANATQSQAITRRRAVKLIVGTSTICMRIFFFEVAFSFMPLFSDNK
ncbi:unnamed protein product, partial [Soboliphyme baturini]|uniref:7TM_GPCR_Srx domain-containing protein n=1 Tax=Soboliphyme baturini TaxID=241478 RepID=A0A183J532_9BILA